MGVVVVTDSGCDLTREEAAQAGIVVVPIAIVFGDRSFRDGVDIDRASFYARLRAGEIPQTQPPSAEDYTALFAQQTAAGNDVVCITLSSQLSKSYENARAAAERFGGRVHAIDSLAASGMQSTFAMLAAERAARGDAAALVARAVDPHQVKNVTLFAVADISHLGRGGRLPKPLVALGSMLGVSLVLKINEQGAIGPAGQSRSFEKTREIMVDALVRSIDRSPDAWVAISHVQTPDTAVELASMLESRLGHPPKRLFIHESTPTIGAHLGIGAVGISALIPSR
jgi:DegV family protein with EDD domain